MKIFLLHQLKALEILSISNRGAAAQALWLLTYEANKLEFDPLFSIVD